MTNRLIINDFKNSKLSSLMIFLFLLTSSLLVATASGLSVHLYRSVGGLFEKAKTPHLMQMHTGEIDREKLSRFVTSHPVIEEIQISEFLNLSGSHIVLSGNSLAASVQDNGFSVQNPKFDFLLDENDRIIRAEKGDVYVPMTYKKEFGLNIGDSATLSGLPFTIRGFVRDSQMNASLVSSKRFVVSPEDLLSLKKSGSPEHLIEFLLSDTEKIGEIENAYIGEGLPANGPPIITLKLFRLINMITDGLMIALLVLISLFIILLSLLCLRFTVITKLNEEYRTIGVLLGIGIGMREIGKLYLFKYTVLAALSSLMGFLLSFPLREVFMAGIRAEFGKTETGILPHIFSAFGTLLVFLFVNFYLKNGIRAFKKVSPAEAIRFGEPVKKGKRPRVFSILKYPLKGNIFLGFREVFYEKKTYIAMLSVLVISVFLAALPFHMYHTVSDKSFIRYMGLGDYDFRFDFTRGENIALKARRVFRELTEKKEVSTANLLLGKRFDCIGKGGKTEKIRVELGDHSLFPVKYKEGRAPASQEEIALSVMNAEELGKVPGDSLTLFLSGKPVSLTVCGIYNDLTNGGKTAKGSFSADAEEVLRAVITVQLKKGEDLSAAAQKYKETYPEVKVSDVESYIEQTFGSTRTAMKKVALLSFPVSLLLSFLLTLLFSRMIYTGDLGRIAALLALGLGHGDIKRQYLFKAVFMAAISLLIGLLLSGTLGTTLGGLILGLFGMRGVQFNFSAGITLTVLPAGLFIAVGSAALLSLRGLSRLRISTFIKE